MLETAIWLVMAAIVAVDTFRYFFTGRFSNTKIAEQEE